MKTPGLSQLTAGFGRFTAGLSFLWNLRKTMCRLSKHHVYKKCSINVSSINPSIAMWNNYISGSGWWTGKFTSEYLQKENKVTQDPKFNPFITHPSLCCINGCPSLQVQVVNFITVCCGSVVEAAPPTAPAPEGLFSLIMWPEVRSWETRHSSNLSDCGNTF